MNFNNVINHLKVWCRNKAEAYSTVYEARGGVTYVGYLLAYELEFKLSTLMDRSFEGTAELQAVISDFIDTHYEPWLSKLQNSEAQHIIDAINNEFYEYLEVLLSKQATLVSAPIPYHRAIIGTEAAKLREKFHSVWGYENTSYWFPLMEEIPVADKFFIMVDYLEPHKKQLEQIIGLPETHVYRYGENNFRPENCTESAELIGYNGCEQMYTDKDFSWAIYFSHENTVTFAGAIVPAVKALLTKEKGHWNKWDWL